jgi:hypothetical protein
MKASVDQAFLVSGDASPAKFNREFLLQGIYSAEQGILGGSCRERGEQKHSLGEVLVISQLTQQKLESVGHRRKNPWRPESITNRETK